MELDPSAADQTKSYARDVLAVLKVQAAARTVGVEPEGEGEGEGGEAEESAQGATTP